MTTGAKRKIRAPVADLAAGKRTLDRDVSRYLCRVLRLRPGDGFIAFDPRAGVESDATIEDDSVEATVVDLGEPRPGRIACDAPVVLVYALAKGDKVDAVVRDATELGATTIVIARTARAIKKAAGADADAKIQRWRRIAEQAARQCGRAAPPAIEGVLDWPNALGRADACDARFCLAPEAEDALGSALARAVARGDGLAFAIGPEGGLTPSEIEQARQCGFVPASLGSLVLRTETVAAAVLGAVRVLTVS
jgi:16S rRNA (uracil1498-N3)-methyltransferase